MTPLNPSKIVQDESLMKNVTLPTLPTFQINLELLAPSVNQLYTGRRFLTPDGKRTKNLLTLMIRSRMKGRRLTGKLRVEICLVFTNNRRNDVDNRVKALLDCCTGILWDDDSQIFELFVKKEIGKKEKTFIQVYEIN